MIIEAVADAIQQADGLAGLTHLDLSHNACGDQGMVAAQPALQRCRALRELVAQSCSIGAAGASVARLQLLPHRAHPA